MTKCLKTNIKIQFCNFAGDAGTACTNSTLKCVILLHQARPQRGGGQGGQCPSSDFRFCPPDLFLAPPRCFWGGKTCWSWAEKTFEFTISARKSLPFWAKTFFFFGDHLILAGKAIGFRHLIFSKTSPQSNSGRMKRLCPPDFNFAPPISRSWRRPCATFNFNFHHFVQATLVESVIK